MGLIAKELGRITPVTATTVGGAQTLVTNATTLDTFVGNIILRNEHTSAVTVNICIVLDTGGAVATADDDDVALTISVDAADFVTLGPDDLRIMLRDTNDTIQVYASVASKINAFAYGFTFTDQA